MSQGNNARPPAPSALANQPRERQANATPGGASSASVRQRDVTQAASASAADAVAGVADTAMSAVATPAPGHGGLADTALSTGGSTRRRTTDARASPQAGLAQAATLAADPADPADNDNPDDDDAEPDASAGPAPGHDPMLDPLIGQVLVDRYRITGKIGQGGMGAVYQAEHQLIGKQVAVKVLLDKYAQRDPVVARLEQEARLASSIGHEHIIDITDFGQTPDGRTFVVMEFLEGESLGACLSREGRLSEARAIHIARQVASALSAAHAKGILHRDVKPENIFLLRRRDQDFVKVVDFGISKSLHTGDSDGSTPRLTQTGMVLGTPLYMSPEQARGEDDLDQRIDIYALGVILYEMVTGEVPFRGSNSLNIIARVLNDEVAPPRDLRADLSRDLEAVILHAMAKDRAQRYASCELLAADLAALADATIDGGDPRSTGRVRLTAPTPAHRKRGLRSLAWLFGLAAVVITVVAAVWLLMAEPEGAHGDLAQAAPAPAPPAPVPTPAPIPALAPTDRADAVVDIEIRTEPPGAAIYEGRRLRGTAPVTFSVSDTDRAIELSAELDGYRPAAFTVNPLTDSDAPVLVRLIKADANPERARTGPRSPARGERDPGADKPPRPADGDDPQRTGTAAGELTGNPYRRSDDPD
ncbi:MAG: hypothetical protein Tsb0020_52470 [Haliangiales bacterium]